MFIQKEFWVILYWLIDTLSWAILGGKHCNHSGHKILVPLPMVPHYSVRRTCEGRVAWRSWPPSGTHTHSVRICPLFFFFFPSASYKTIFCQSELHSHLNTLKIIIEKLLILSLKTEFITLQIFLSVLKMDMYIWYGSVSFLPSPTI